MVGPDRVEATVGLTEGGAGVGLALVRPERHGPLGLRGDGQRGVDAEVGRHGCTIDDVQAVVAVEPLPRVDHTGLRGLADGAAADDVCGQGDVHDLAHGSPGHAVDAPCQSARHLVAGWDPRRVGLAVSLSCDQSLPQQTALAAHRERVV